MDSYKFSKPGTEKGNPMFEAVRIAKLLVDGEILSVNVLGITDESDDLTCWGDNCRFRKVWAFCKPNPGKDIGERVETVWSTDPDTKPEGFIPLCYSTGEQLVARFMESLFTPLEKGYTCTFAMFAHKGQDKEQVKCLHTSDIKANRFNKPVPKIDWIFGLSELKFRIDMGNIQPNSVLAISYKGEEYQTREWVFHNAIRKGFGGEDLKILADILGTGRVVFAGLDFYVGTVSYEPREMTPAELALFQMKAGRNPEHGIIVAEDVIPRLEEYLDYISPERTAEQIKRHGYIERFRYDENCCKIRQLT